MAPLARASERATQSPDAVALIADGGAETLTAAEFTAAVEVLAGTMDGDRGPVAIELPSGPQLLTAFAAAAAAGRPACVAHLDFAPEERARALQAAGATHVLNRSGELAPTGASGVPLPAVDDDPIFYIGFTSGTSGAPKPFARRWKSWESSFDAAAELHRIGPGTTVLLPGSLAHSHFLFGAVLGLEREATVHTFSRFDAALLVEQLERSEDAVLFVVPTMLSAIEPVLEGRAPLDQVRSVIVSGSAFDGRHREISRAAFPEARIVQIFGASELSFVTVAVDDPGGPPPGDDVGVPFPGVEIELRGDNSEIWVRSPFLFAGHLSADGALDDTLDEEGFATVGDLGRFDDDGRLSLIGRGSNMIITGGKNVHPEEIEAVLRDRDEVEDCVVVGLPDEYWGERLVGLLELRAPIDDSALVDAVRERLSPHKAPKQWIRVDALPRTVSGKVARARARELALDAV